MQNKLIKKTLPLFCFILLTQPAYAMFCPTNFNMINIGDSREQVIKQCGKPDAQTSHIVTTNIPQEWNYYITPSPTSPASLKMVIAFNNNKVINIEANAMSLTTTNLCGGNLIQVGYSQEQVKAACGEPAFIKQMQAGSALTTTPPNERTEFRYNSHPPTTLIFRDGKLVERKQ